MLLKYDKTVFNSHQFYIGKLYFGFNFSCMKRFVVSWKRSDGFYNTKLQIDL